MRPVIANRRQLLIKFALVLVLSIATGIAILFLGGCSTVPAVPKTVTVTVEKYKPLPSWATDPLPKPEPADGTVRERVRSHDARGAVIDYANCLRALVKRLDAGDVVTGKECQAP